MARSVRLNIIANYVGSGWSALMGFVFVPVYISFLGIEAYGLIGLFATLQAWLSLLDLGLSPTLNREMARLRGGAHTAQSIRDLLRTIEVIYAATAFLMALGIFLAAGWLTSSWLHVEALPVSTVAAALSITGLVIAFRWMGGLYRSALGGLQEQVWLNASNLVFSTLRGAGAIAVLVLIQNSISAYFIFQGLVAALEAATLGFLVHHALPKAERPGHFRPSSLRQVARFAAGVTGITLLSLLLGQVDKIVLSGTLSLADFGNYALAGAVAGGLSAAISPVATAVGPRFAELVARGAKGELVGAYHRYTQLMAMILIPACIVIAVFSHEILLLWTSSENTTVAVAPIVSVLVIGAALNGLLIVPYMLQLAYGWTRLSIYSNLVGAIILVPAIAFVGPRWGGMGAACVWAGWNAASLAVVSPIVHRRLMPGQLKSWVIDDILPPTVAAIFASGAVRLLMHDSGPSDRTANAETVGLAVFVAGILATMSTAIGREVALRILRRMRTAMGGVR